MKQIKLKKEYAITARLNGVRRYQMSILPSSETKTNFSIHPATRIGHVSLNVANLENQLAFYQQALGFHLHWRDGNKAGLGARGADLLQLVEQPDYKRYQRVTGLYHL